MQIRYWPTLLTGFVLWIASCVWATPAAAQTVTTAFTGATVIADTLQPPVANATILVRNGRIVQVGPSNQVTIPANATRVPLGGKFIMPGLVNAHGHVRDTANPINRTSSDPTIRDLKLYVSYGVTTVLFLGGEQEGTFGVRNEQDRLTLNRARARVAGSILAPETPADARRMVAENAAQHVDIIKIRVDDNLHGNGGTARRMAPEVYGAVIDEAHKRGLRVAVHEYYLADATRVVNAGADYLAHSVRDLDVDDELIRAMKGRDVCLSPTLMREVSTFVYETTPAFFSDALFLKYSDRTAIDSYRDPARQQQVARDPFNARYKAGLAQAKKNLKRLADAGIRIAMGTDTGPDGRFQGYFELMELQQMADAGLTPKQVLTAATRDAAQCGGVETQVGTLSAGKWADLLVLDADPLADVRNVMKIDSVWVAGNKVPR